MAKKKKAAKSSEVEQELKLQLSHRDLEKVFAVLRKKAIGKKVEHKYLPRAYFDTRDLLLYRNSVSVRVQYKPGKEGKIGGYEQTVKFDLPPEKGVVSGAFFRKECKDMVAGHVPLLAKISDAEGRAVAKRFRAKRLFHIFTAAIERRSFNLKVGRGKKAGVVEVAFDVGEIFLDAQGRRQAFSEIEIEMVKGHPDAIHTAELMVRGLARSAALQPLSKAQQGSRLYRAATRRNKTHR
ncbi:MAG: CYTH domain-containing protein [Alphaproteobacteria bacterium]|nr:CYTH domain-containing protein [Alphaproteobacteria bacterium]